MTIGLVDIDCHAKASPATNIYKHYINKSTSIMTQNDQIELLKLIRKNLVNAYCDVNHKFNDVNFTDKMRTIIDQLDILTHEFNEAGLQPATQIAVQYMKNEPNASADKVCDFVEQVMKTIKSV